MASLVPEEVLSWQVAAAAVAVLLTALLIHDRDVAWTCAWMYNIHEACEAAYRRRKPGVPIQRFRWWVKPLVIVTDPRKAMRVLSNDAIYFDYTLPVFTALWGPDKPMLMINNKCHKVQRKQSAFILSPEFAETARPTIRAVAATWVRKFDHGSWAKLNIDEINQLTWAMISALTTGDDTPDFRHDMLQEVHNARTAGLYSTVFPPALQMYAWWVRTFRPRFHQWERFVRGRIREHREGKRELGPIVARLVSDGDADDDHIFGIIAALHVAGHHAPSAAITFAIYHLLADDKLMAQTKEAIDDNEWLTQVLKETVRLYPGGAVSRFFVVQKPDEVTGVRPGEMILVPWYSFHRDPTWNKDANKFDPSREQAQGNFFPFGLGAHSCVGQRLVRPMFEEAVRTILGELDLRLDAKTLKFHTQLVTAEPDHPMHDLMWCKAKASANGGPGNGKR